jgi:hypothetical protein
VIAGWDVVVQDAFTWNFGEWGFNNSVLVHAVVECRPGTFLIGGHADGEGQRSSPVGGSVR